MAMLDTLKQKVEEVETKVEEMINPQSSDAHEEEVEEAPQEPIVSDRSIYNCPDCAGEGLKSETEICPTCVGTGKV